MRKLLYILPLLICLFGQYGFAQNRLINKGNQLYEEKRYKEAANVYQRALADNPTYLPGLFNLSNSLYQQKQFDASRQVLEKTAKITKDKGAKGELNYNIGNSYMEEKKYEDAVNYYKHALRNNSSDPDAKYNLSYAEEMLKKQQSSGGKSKDKNKDNKQDKQNKDQQNKDKQDKDKQDQKKQDQQKEEKDKQDKQDQQAQAQPSKLSQQQADQLLNALQQEEKKLQDKKQKEKGVPVRLDKDW